MKEIKLSQGLFSQVDDSDFDWLNKWKWTAAKMSNIYYAVRQEYINGKRKLLFMHREILNTPKGLEVDHIDHNGLNNQRENIRNATSSQNKHNKTACGSSKYLGVSVYNQKGHVYIKAEIRINGKNINLGLFPSEKLAAIAYDNMAKKHFGEFANPNFK